MAFYRNYLIIILFCFLHLLEVLAQNVPDIKIHKRENVKSVKAINEIKWGGHILVTSDITVDKEDTLFIEPGTIVDFQDTFAILIYGCIMALGKKNNPILFTRNDTAGFSDFSTSNGGWQGIRFINDNDHSHSKLLYCTVEFVKVTGNSRWGHSGGAIHANNYHLEIQNCIIRNNFAELGGGISCDGADLSLSHSYVYNNDALYGGGALISNSSAVILNNIFYNNRARKVGGGLFFERSPDKSVMLNNTICDNEASNGGGIYLSHYSDIDFKNNIIYYNRGEVQENQIGVGHRVTLNINNCDIQGGKEEITIDALENEYEGIYDNNIDISPQFLNQAVYNYNLEVSSPCIDQGDNSGVDILKYDIADRVRIWDGNNDNIDVIDMGAYEFGSVIIMQVTDSVTYTSTINSADGAITVRIEYGLSPYFITLYKQNEIIKSINNAESGEYTFSNLITGYYDLIVNDSKGIYYDKNIFLGYISEVRFSIEGTVTADNKYIEDGAVLAYQYRENHYELKYITPISKGKFKFEETASARYILCAVPDPFWYSNILPGYYAKVLNWQNAHIIDVYGITTSVDIMLNLRKESQIGNAILSGLVIYENLPDSNGILERNWFDLSEEPSVEVNIEARNIIIILYKNNEPVGWEITDQHGLFEFDHLPVGEYKLDVQYPGYEISGESGFIISNDNMTTIKASIYIRESDIRIYYSGINPDPDKITIRPNPFSSQFRIEFNSIDPVNFNLLMYDMTGRKVVDEYIFKSSQTDYYDYFNNTLANGNYHCVIKTDSYTKNFTLLKK